MVVAFTGRRSPALGDESVVRERLHAYLTRSGPTAVVGAAACGADLLVLEEALRLEIDPEVVLPTPLAADKDVVALIIAAPGESEYTEGFARSADALGVPVTRLDELGLRFEARNSASPRPG